ncbi:hypothetical protein JOB18_011402 [Solea senegalensis]|uniref:Uncharacterized protein n=1 Tax=Solea senegalensis TaxID=28829 RepID=A0AAV6PFV2_SOLSE|nr:hypothetical protein JOB18_011402 [Solea senegalensis]
MESENRPLLPQQETRVHIGFYAAFENKRGRYLVAFDVCEQGVGTIPLLTALICSPEAKAIDQRHSVETRGRGVTAVNRLHGRFLSSIKDGSRAAETAASQDVTGSSIDWLRLKIGESGRIDAPGAWTQRWTLRDRERDGRGADIVMSLCELTQLSTPRQVNLFWFK